MFFTTQLIRTALLPAIFFLTGISFLVGEEAVGGVYREVSELYENGEYEASLDLLKTMPVDEAQTVFWLGKNHLQLMQPKIAVQWLERAVQIDEQPDYLVELSGAYGAMIPDAGFMQKGRLAKKSLKSLERAVELDPDHFEAQVGLMHYYEFAPSFMGGGAQKAIHAGKEARRIDPVAGGIALGRYHFRQGAYRFARIEFERAGEAGVDNPEPGYWVLAVMLAAKDYASWMTHYERFVERFPDHLGAAYQLGKYAAITGREAENGIAALEGFLAKEEDGKYPDHASAHWRLGMIYEQLGDKEQSAAEYQAAQELDPGNETYQKALASLGSQ